ncbi:UbiA family prenyltransferase [Halomicrobium salinisoli]|uniref:UbiA family prenyltransferase n=1 Tax=Halomicrobium salinisoli TaxID=2878391 RepID=UPI001CF092FA|nr:UbiA family prenyltransferase [Halomicrobium salinisoli]
MAATAAGAERSTPAAVAALVRVPNLFTAPPDVILGAALAAAAGATVRPVTVAGLAVASMLLYAGGTALNDAFDAPADAADRPERPIPAGEISRRAAFGLGAALLFGGILTAAAATGVAGGVAAAAVAAGVALYDGALKGGAAGFLAMGAVRGLNVVLGTAVAGRLLPLRWLLPAVALAAYVAAVTFMAARETEGENRPAVAVAGLAAVLAVAAAAVHHWIVGPDVAGTALGALLAAGFLAWVGSALRPAYADPVPETIGPAVGRCVLAIAVVDGAVAAATGPRWAVAAVAFLAPAVGLSRAFDVT